MIILNPLLVSYGNFCFKKIGLPPGVNFDWILSPQALCFQMDFTRTVEANAKCNNINHVWSHFCKILVVLKYHRRPWANISDRDICRSINIPNIAKYTTINVGIYASRNVCIKHNDSRAFTVLQNYQKFIASTSNMIHIDALGVGFKCPCKIHLNTQCQDAVILF